MCIIQKQTPTSTLRKQKATQSRLYVSMWAELGFDVFWKLEVLLFCLFILLCLSFWGECKTPRVEATHVVALMVYPYCKPQGPNCTYGCHGSWPLGPVASRLLARAWLPVRKLSVRVLGTSAGEERSDVELLPRSVGRRGGCNAQGGNTEVAQDPRGILC